MRASVCECRDGLDVCLSADVLAEVEELVVRIRDAVIRPRLVHVLRHSPKALDLSLAQRELPDRVHGPLLGAHVRDNIGPEGDAIDVVLTGVGPVAVALDLALLHLARHHDNHRNLLLPHHAPEGPRV